ncbi:hypothetical protein V8F06_003701 [Rhypophila decipiens]
MPDEHPTTIGLVESAPERVIACLDDILLLGYMGWEEHVLLMLEQVLQFKDPEATPFDEQIAQHFDRVFENGWSTNLPIPRPPKIRDITFDDLKVYIGNFNCNLPADGDRDSKPEASPPPHRREGARAFAMAGQFEIEDDSGAKRIGITEFVTDSQGEWVDPWFLLIGIGPAYEHKFKREALLKWKKVVLDRIVT